MTSLFEQIATTSYLEWVAVILALAYVVLAAKQHWLCWPCALVSTAIYTYLFWQVTLPFQSLLNAYYMVMAVYGFWQWRIKSESEKHVVVSSIPIALHGFILVGGIVLAYMLATLFSGQFNNQYLWLDASIHLLSMATTVMVAHKKIENWYYWMGINAAAAWLYWQSGLLLTALLFVFYVGFSVYGYSQWKRDLVT